MQPRQIGIAVAAALAAFVVAFGVSKASGSETAKKPSAPAAKLAAPKTVDVAAASVTTGAGQAAALPTLKSDPKKKAKKSSSSSSSSSTSTASAQSTTSQSTQTQTQTQTTQTQTQNSAPRPKPRPKPTNTNDTGSVSGGGEG
jgi:hypothetical protein